MGSEVGFSDEEMELLESQNKEAGFSDDEIEALEANEKYPGWQSALAGAQDTALMGYGPNALAATKTMSFSSPEYIKERDRLNQEVAAMKEEDPTQFLAGQVGGGAASLLVPGGAVAKGVGLASRIGRAAAIGTAVGAASDTPDVEGQVTSPTSIEDLKERAINAGTGMLMGPLAELGVSTIKAVSPDEIARAFAALQPGKAARREARLAAEGGGLSTKDNIVAFAREEGILKGLPDADEMYKRALASKDKYGDALNTVYRRAQEVIDNEMHSGINSSTVKYYASMKNLGEIKNNVINEIRRKKWADADKDTAMKQLGDYFDSIAQEVGPEPDLLQLHNIKTAIGSKSFKEGRAELPTSTEEFWRAAGRIVDDEIKKRVDGLAELAGRSRDKQLGEFLREANKRYSLASDIYGLAGDAVDSAMGRLPRDLDDMFGYVLRSPGLNLGLSKVGRGISKIPDALKPSGPQVAMPIQQIINDATRVPSPNELFQQRMPKRSLIDRAKIVNQERKALKGL